MTTQFLSNSRLLQRWGIDRSTSYRWRKTGLLPKPDMVINGRPRWRIEVIEDFERRHGLANANDPVAA